MSGREAPTLVLDNPEKYQPNPVPQPEARSAVTLPPTEGNERKRPGLSDVLKRYLGKIVIADGDGTIPYWPTNREKRWRPESPYIGWPFFRLFSPGRPHRKEVNAIEPRAYDAIRARTRGFHYGNHDHVIDSTVATIRALAVQLHANQYHPTSRVTYQGAIDPTGHKRSGYGTTQFRRPLARIVQAFGGIRSPEHQISDEQKLSLREIGRLHNLDLHIAEVDILDKSGHFAKVLSSGDPQAVRRELGYLSDQGVIPETNPLHARWSAAMDPKNVKAFRQYIIESSDKEIHGETPAAAILHMNAAGIMGGMRPRAVADYLGVPYDQWDKQRYGFPSDSKEPHAVPKEVVDQICLLMKLDNRIVDYRGTQPRTALDILIDVDAAKPLTEPRLSTNQESPLSKSPMGRVEDKYTAKTRLGLEEQDRIKEQNHWLSMQYSARLEDINRRLAMLDPDEDEDKDTGEKGKLLKQKAKLSDLLKQLSISVPDIQDNVKK